MFCFVIRNYTHTHTHTALAAHPTPRWRGGARGAGAGACAILLFPPPLRSLASTPVPVLAASRCAALRSPPVPSTWRPWPTPRLVDIGGRALCEPRLGSGPRRGLLGLGEAPSRPVVASFSSGPPQIGCPRRAMGGLRRGWPRRPSLRGGDGPFSSGLEPSGRRTRWRSGCWPSRGAAEPTARRWSCAVVARRRAGVRDPRGTDDAGGGADVTLARGGRLRPGFRDQGSAMTRVG